MMILHRSTRTRSITRRVTIGIPTVVLLTTLVAFPLATTANAERPQLRLLETDREALILRRTMAQIGVVFGTGLLVGGSLAAWETHQMCVGTSPDDDCGAAQPMAGIGTGLLLVAGVTVVVWASYDWADAQARLDDAVIIPSIAPTPDGDGAVLTVHARF